MITGTLRSKIDKLWEEFWTGGITNPLTVIEQISFLMFARLLDSRENQEEKKFGRQHPGKEFPGRYFTPETQHIRWKNLKHEADAQAVLKLVKDELFPHMSSLADSSSDGDSAGSDAGTFGDLMRDAQFMIQKPNLLQSAIAKIEEFPLDKADTKGDLYEYLLSKLTTAGINGQFRTPRHIIEAMVQIAAPQPTERVCDPACGTAGFLVGTMEYLRKEHSSEEGIIEYEDGHKTYTGDLLAPHMDHIQSELLTGLEFDTTMLRIASMNAMLHGVDAPDIKYQDTLSTRFDIERSPEAEDYFDLILANPPFKGSLDYDDVHKSLLGKVKTKKTELLFLVLILRMLKLGGRAAVIVPDGVLFGSSKAHKALRKMIVDENQLEAVISLPSGVFKPYAGVSTAILYFTKGGKTENVFFYDLKADGFSLDDKRDPVNENDLPDLLARWESRDSKKDTDKKEKAFFVAAKEIAQEGYDLSVGRYREVLYEEVVYDAPPLIIQKLRSLDGEIRSAVDELEKLL